MFLASSTKITITRQCHTHTNHITKDACALLPTNCPPWPQRALSPTGPPNFHLSQNFSWTVSCPTYCPAHYLTTPITLPNTTRTSFSLKLNKRSRTFWKARSKLSNSTATPTHSSWGNHTASQMSFKVATKQGIVSACPMVIKMNTKEHLTNFAPPLQLACYSRSRLDHLLFI